MTDGHEKTGFEPVLERARLDDLGAVVAIDATSQRWTHEAFASELGHEPPTVYVLRLSGAVAGFAVIRMVGADLDIVNVAVEEAQRRQGLGRSLLRQLFAHAGSRGVGSVFLEVRESNQAARALYESLGFDETQRRRNFYANPVEDAVLMSLKIAGSQG